jgi:hypothetical protein
MSIYISEHPALRANQGDAAPAVEMPPLATQRVANDGATTQSAAFTSATRIVCVHSDSICSVEFGENPVATTSSRRLSANSTEYFSVTPGHKVAAILNT